MINMYTRATVRGIWSICDEHFIFWYVYATSCVSHRIYITDYGFHGTLFCDIITYSDDLPFSLLSLVRIVSCIGVPHRHIHDRLWIAHNISIDSHFAFRTVSEWLRSCIEFVCRGVVLHGTSMVGPCSGLDISSISSVFKQAWDAFEFRQVQNQNC